MKKWIVFSALFVLIACGEEEVKQDDINWSKKESTELNKELIEEEKIQIKLYLAHHSDWKVTETGTGLRYFIYENGSGEIPKVGQKAHVVLNVELLDGTLCYSTEKEMEDIFIVDKSDIETGIQEAIKLMKVGDKAKLIIPAHLGHGITGDLDKIPPLSTLVVDIQLNKLV